MTEPNNHGHQTPPHGTGAHPTTEQALRAEIESLRRQLEGHRPHGHGAAARKGPSAGVLWGLALFTVVVLVVAFFLGYVPMSSRETALAKETREESAALPIVNVSEARRSSGTSELVLPGSIQAITEAPLLARATGYLKTRAVDIGDNVKAGQLLAEIDAVEVEHQVMQAKSQINQARAGLEQANANLVAAKTNEEMAKVSSDRWNALLQRGAVARQDADSVRTQYEAQLANVQAMEKAVAMAQSQLSGAEQNERRLEEVQSYQKVRAPFTGIITQRNVDTGALVNEGNTLLFRIAQIDKLRTYVNVPQSDAGGIHVGQTAKVTVANLQGKTFLGTVTRTANALDPATRTLLAEVQVANPDNQLLPGMYAQVNFTTPRAEPPIVIPGDTLVLRADGPQAAVVGQGDVIHFAKLQVGRDFGDRLEVLAGLAEGDRLVINPSDTVREGVKVKPVLLAEAKSNKK